MSADGDCDGVGGANSLQVGVVKKSTVRSDGIVSPFGSTHSFAVTVLSIMIGSDRSVMASRCNTSKLSHVSMVGISSSATRFADWHTHKFRCRRCLADLETDCKVRVSLAGRAIVTGNVSHVAGAPNF